MLVFEHTFDSTEIYRAVPQVLEEEWVTVTPTEVRFALEIYRDRKFVQKRYLDFERASGGLFLVYVTPLDLNSIGAKVGDSVYLTMHWTYGDKTFAERCLLKIMP